MPTYSISAIPVPPSDKDVQKYADLRLLTLKTDHPRFSSLKYPDALLMTKAQWRERLDAVDKVTIYATEEGAAEEADWAGLITILTPECPSLLNLDPPTEPGLENYMVVGMVVHPEHRKRGVAKKLIEAGKIWAGSRAGSESKRLLLEVNDFNEIARKAYRSTGFFDLDHPGVRGHIWMATLL
ncbi:hypothetical protein C8J56DRAFT_1060293 [Mycena floridula]|nr:hypothetical protein C8J56DRAFT_1060293 [Mycena floridula]